MKTVLSVDVAKNKSMIMLMNSDGERLIDTREIQHNLEDFEKVREDFSGTKNFPQFLHQKRFSMCESWKSF